MHFRNNPFTSSSSLNFPCSNSLIFWTISCFPCSMLIDFLKPSAVLDSYNVCKLKHENFYDIKLYNFYNPHRVSMKRHSRLISQPGNKGGFQIKQDQKSSRSDRLIPYFKLNEVNIFVLAQI